MEVPVLESPPVVEAVLDPVLEPVVEPVLESVLEPEPVADAVLSVLPELAVADALAADSDEMAFERLGSAVVEAADVDIARKEMAAAESSGNDRNFMMCDYRDPFDGSIRAKS